MHQFLSMSDTFASFAQEASLALVNVESRSVIDASSMTWASVQRDDCDNIDSRSTTADSPSLTVNLWASRTSSGATARLGFFRSNARTHARSDAIFFFRLSFWRPACHAINLSRSPANDSIT